LSVYLCEQGDFAAATSSASTKLIHGGLRYLENMDFRLVREALAEREVLLRIAPHLVRPLRFVLPHHSGLRPAWMLRLGLWVYDHLGGPTTLPPARTIDIANDPVGAVLKSGYRRAFEYSDCSVDDSRLVILNAMDAADRGASINPRTRCVSAERRGGLWQLTLQDMDGNVHYVSARALVNASGPWVNDVLKSMIGINPSQPVRLDKGSHIVVRRRFGNGCAFIFQNADGRIVFAIPFQAHFTLIGTTESDYRGDPATAAVDDREIEYLLRAVNLYFREPISRSEIVWNYAGVRVLCERPGKQSQKLSREYVLALDEKNSGAPLLSIYGGKITTYRRLAEAALTKLAPSLQMRGTWTGDAPLPGGNMPQGLQQFTSDCAARYRFLDEVTLTRLVAAYGSRTPDILRDAKDWADLGKSFGSGLTQAELDYLIAREWATTAEDVVWRRTKLGLHLNTSELHELKVWMQNNRSVMRHPAR
jgi:glycerol-3-phosphate dehydrogenase